MTLTSNVMKAEPTGSCTVLRPASSELISREGVAFTPGAQFSGNGNSGRPSTIWQRGEAMLGSSAETSGHVAGKEDEPSSSTHSIDTRPTPSVSISTSDELESSTSMHGIATSSERSDRFAFAGTETRRCFGEISRIVPNTTDSARWFGSTREGMNATRPPSKNRR